MISSIRAKLSIMTLNLIIYLFVFVGIFCVYTGGHECPKYAGKDESCKCSQCRPGLICDANQVVNGEKQSICVIDPSVRRCKGELENGRCFCYNTQGHRIFGWSWWKDAEEMTCACSRERDILSDPLISLHCRETGNYDELQCSDGMCWCVESTTGVPVDRIFPECLMTLLPCYLEQEVGAQYLRQCESKHVARGELVRKIEAHGMEFAHVLDSFCDWDGSYGQYTVNGMRIFCTSKDGNRLGIYVGAIADVPLVTCNCARDTQIFEDLKMNMLLSCHGTGNYDVMQAHNGRLFCVDGDGYPTTPLADFGTSISCP